VSRINPHGVRVGQVYTDNDKRLVLERKLRVVDIEGAYAICKATTTQGGVRTMRIQLKRFKDNAQGYRRLDD